MTRQEFRQLWRDRRTLALLVFQPILLLLVFGYVARFDVASPSSPGARPLARFDGSELFAARSVMPVRRVARAVARRREAGTVGGA